MEDGRIIHHGWSPQCNVFPSESVDTWGVLKTTAVQPGAFLAHENKALPSHLAARVNLEVHEGDLLLTCAGPRSRCGIACLVRETRPRLIFSGKMYRFRSAPSVMEARFLEAFLQTFHVWQAIDAMKTGGNDSGLNLTHDRFRQLLIPVAPIAEQRRIVARVDALFAEIAEGEAGLVAARKELDVFRRALLKAAVTGELTKDWRAANPVSKTGRDLLAGIAKDRVRSGGRALRSAEAPPLDTSILPRLPSGWDWATLGGIAESVRNGTSAAPRAASNEHEILRISAVRPLRIDEAQIRFLDDDQAKAAAAATVEAGDLLFTRYNGSADFVGVGAIYSGPKRFYPDKIIRVRLEPVLSMLSEFVELAVNTGASRKHIAANIKTTAGQQGLSGESLKATPIPIPPPAEAAEIVRRVSEALSAATDTLAMLDAEAADAARLKQSILKAAFEGRLVPQHPTDEPVSALLARSIANPSAMRAKRGRTRKPNA
jgi:type I restriction enzyme S subunit